jgi:hypothetical protein
VILQQFGQAKDVDAGDVDLIDELALDVGVQSGVFGTGEVAGVEAVAEGVGVAGLRASVWRTLGWVVVMVGVLSGEGSEIRIRKETGD